MGTFRSIVVFLVLVTLAACGSPPTAPPPVPDAPTLSCPASASIQSPNNVAMPVTFTVPVAVGGQSPVSVTCTAQSGAAFPLGSTIVTCTATDALARQASCNFNVTVTPTPRISKTTFLAFGDSITVGRCNERDTYCPSYSGRLESLLRARYVAQAPTVSNVSANGRTAAEGEDLLPAVLSSAAPEVLLLMMGTNDINAGESAEGIESLEDMILIAKGQGRTVMLATIVPARTGGPWDATARLIPAFNDQVRAIAARHSVVLVDVYAALNADIARYIGSDDLHPSEAGHQLIAETFYASIRSAFDNTPADTFTRASFAPRSGWVDGPSLQGGIGTPPRPLVVPRVRRQ